MKKRDRLTALKIILRKTMLVTFSILFHDFLDFLLLPFVNNHKNKCTITYKDAFLSTFAVQREF
jgi:uncharacterized membrane protein